MANLASMFAQLNNTIAANPLAQPVDATVPGMAARPQDTINPMLSSAIKGLSGAVGADTAPLQTSQEAYLGGMKAIESLDLSSSEGLTQAAKVYQKLGMQPQALQMLERAEAKKQATSAKENALLDSQNQAIQEEAAKKRRRQQKMYAIAIAKNKGDGDAVMALKSDALEPTQYLQEQTKTGKPTTLADGAMLVGPDGTILAENPKDPTGGVWGGDLSATMQKRLNASGDAYREAESLAREYGSMLDRIDTLDLGSGGWGTTALTAINQATGRRDDDDFFRTQAIKLKNSEAISQLPAGPASDTDVAIVMRGFPGDNAGAKEIKEFLESSKRVAEDVATYEQFKSDYISNNGDERGFVTAWKRKAQQIAEMRYKEATPVEAIEYLQAHPETRDKFLATFKWLPEGM